MNPAEHIEFDREAFTHSLRTFQSMLEAAIEHKVS
jgi:hypothetical protein